ncbi:MAG TPA: T9SS type A sorting domain-containing protein, partial [Paludibacteraceae bacterium]|nr:T9SS type A sorting domain-containing protein [Paludibacteraceae bacterium]
TYTLVSGDGSTDNASFNISGSSLRITASPDFETKDSYSVRVRTTDQGSLTFEKVFTITIINVDEAPTVTTQAVSSIGETTATGNGNITNLGDSNPTQYGVVWSTSNNPTVDLTTKTEEGAIAVCGVFTSSITGLIKNTTYYVKAYATNATGTVYGDEVSFTTLDVTTNINESMITSFNIYPNPAKEKIMIQGMTKGDKAYLYNQSGQLVLISDKAEIDIAQLQSGIYMIRINEKVVKLIKD